MRYFQSILFVLLSLVISYVTSQTDPGVTTSLIPTVVSSGQTLTITEVFSAVTTTGATTVIQLKVEVDSVSLTETLFISPSETVLVEDIIQGPPTPISEHNVIDCKETAANGLGFCVQSVSAVETDTTVVIVTSFATTFFALPTSSPTSSVSPSSSSGTNSSQPTSSSNATSASTSSSSSASLSSASSNTTTAVTTVSNSTSSSSSTAPSPTTTPVAPGPVSPSPTGGSSTTGPTTVTSPTTSPTDSPDPNQNNGGMTNSGPLGVAVALVCLGIALAVM